MELFDTVYEGKVIPFDFYKDNVMINSSETIKMFPNKRMSDFLASQSTQNFIKACLNNGNSRYLNVEIEEDLINSKQKSGTWMHRVLALKFAAWLDSEFELWVYCTIDKILFDHYRRLEDSLKDSAKRKHEIDKIRQKLRQDDLYMKLEQLELEEKQAAYARSKGNRQRLSVYKGALEEEE